MNPAIQVLEEHATSPKAQVSPIQKRMEDVPKVDGRKITIAVYGFQDKTGQRYLQDYSLKVE